MRIMQILGLTGLGIIVIAQSAMSQRGGAVRSGMRGAAVGGMMGGSEGAEKGAKVGMVTGATRTAIDHETVARTQYQATAEYKNAPHSNLNDAPPDVLGVPAAATETKPSGQGESVIRKDGKPLVGITFPADWKQKMGDQYVAAASGDGQAYAVLATLSDVADKQVGIKKVIARLDTYLKDIKFDEQTETKGGALVITGTGVGKKAGSNVTFAVGVFDASKGQLAGAAFVVDSKIEDLYKETVLGICQTLRRADDFTKN